MSSHTDFPTAPPNAGVRWDHPHRSGAGIIDAAAGVVERKRDKLAIVGYATSSRDLAPFDDPDFEIVGLNQLYRFIPRADFWADLHINWYEDNVEGTDHRGWIRDSQIPVLMTERHDDLPMSVRFPIEGVIESVGVDYFTSTIALLLGWAIHQGYKHIALFGIDLVVGTEYEVQKACAEFLLGVAHGRNITVQIPPQCALLKQTHRYGYEREPAWGPVSLAEFTARRAQLQGQCDETVAKLHALDGALHEVVRREAWLADPAAREAWLRERHAEALSALGVLNGAIQETSYWRELLLLRSRGAGVQLIAMTKQGK